jgi:hypothetical protein
MDVRIVPTIAIVCLYIVLTAGFQVLLHTCGGETTVHLFSGAGEDPCGCGDMHEQDRCCTTQVITVHLDDVQQGATVTLPAPDVTVSLTPARPQDGLVYQPAVAVLQTAGSSPPSSTPSHILNCTFLI